MTVVNVEGLDIHYETFGEGPPVVITPGGRYGKDVVGLREFATTLADGGMQAIIWDRPNTGMSDICFDRGFEPEMQADALAGLIRALGLGQASLIGGSNGSRVAMLTSARHPEVVTNLAVLWVSSGLFFTAMELSMHYCGYAWDVARRTGMQGVADLAKGGPVDWPSTEQHAANRARMLAMDPAWFMEIMEDWGAKFLSQPGSPVAGMVLDSFASISAPTLVFNSSPTDLNHPRQTTERVHELIAGSKLVELPFDPEEWNIRTEEFISTGAHVHFKNWKQLAPGLLDFFSRDETPNKRSDSA